MCLHNVIHLSNCTSTLPFPLFYLLSTLSQLCVMFKFIYSRLDAICFCSDHALREHQGNRSTLAEKYEEKKYYRALICTIKVST